MGAIDAKHRILLWLLAALLAWRGAASLVAIGSEVERRGLHEVRDALVVGEDERIRRELGRWEAAKGLVPGREFALFRALRAEVGRDGMVFLVDPKTSVKRFLTITHMNVLLYPRSFFPVAALPPNWTEAAADLAARCYILEYDGARAPGVGRWCDRVAAGEDFVLWHYRGRG